MLVRIINGRVIDPGNGIDRNCDLYIKNGVISEIGDNIGSIVDDRSHVAKDVVIDAKGMWVVPGLIDMHVHFREPGYEYKETIESGSKSAAAGGFTTVCCMPNCNPVTDSGKAIRNIIDIADRVGLINVLPVGSITKGLDGVQISNISEMAEAGAVAISDDGKTVANARLMMLGMVEAKKNNLPVLAHCEDINLVNGGVINEGAYAMGMRGINSESEDVIVARDITLAKNIGAKLHICHVSTKGSTWLLRSLMDRNGSMMGNISAEASPHHFTLTDADVKLRGNYKMNPPLRAKDDIEAVREALHDGTIGVIATDHAPHAAFEKECDFERAANGIVGLETAVGVSITSLVKGGILSPVELVAKLTYNPAKILGIDRGTLGVGRVADITVIDPEEEWIVDSGKFFSKATNTPFSGMKLWGKVKYTISSGRVVYVDGD